MSDSAMHVIGPILIIVALIAILEVLKAVSRTLEKSQSPLLNRLPTVFVGLMLTVGGFLFWLYLVGNPINEMRLITDGVTAKGVITDVREGYEDCDSCPGRKYLHYNASYTFQLPNGQTVEAETKDSNGLRPDIIANGIEVEYLPDSPEVNRIKGTGSPTFTDWIWRKAGIGGLLLVMCLSPGVGLIHWGVRRKPEGSSLPHTRKTGPLP
jgi:uncharacterized protein DUF3592